MGRTGGLACEFAEIRAGGALHRLLLVVPPDPRAAQTAWTTVREALLPDVDIGDLVPDARVLRILEAGTVLVLCSRQRHADAYVTALHSAVARATAADADPGSGLGRCSRIRWKR